MHLCELLNARTHLSKLFTKCPDLGIGMLSATIGFTFDLIRWRHDGAASGDSICGVLLGIASVKVIGIDTRWPIAVMQAIETFGNGALVEFVRKAMRLDCAPADANLPVTVLIVATRPVPAITWAALVNLCPEAICCGPDRPVPDRVTNDKANRFACHMPKFSIVADRSGGRLSATALAKTGRIGWIHLFASSVMPINIAQWFALDPTRLLACTSCGPCLLPTPAMAVAIGYFIRGFIRGIITHIRRSFQRLNVPGDVATSARFCFASL